jgi:glycosyltransferase involved in cell wall biosynthesis
MKILFISPTFSGAGGIGPHAFRVSEKLSQEGHDIELMDTPHIPIKNLKNVSFSVFGTLKALSNSKTYDAVHAWNVPSAFIMKHIKAKKKILSIHGIYSEQVKMLHSKLAGSIVTSKEDQVLDWADVLTTDSKYVQMEYKKKLGKDFEYIPAPLDPKKFADIPDVKKNQKQVVYVGRDSFEKGTDILKEIESKIDGNVKYCTSLPWNKAMEILKASQVFVLPSRVESVPQSILEAFFLKIPVIATDVGGVHEIVINNKTGLLITPNDSSELLDKINYLLNDSELCNTLANNAYEFILKNFSWEALLPKYIKLYKSL